MRIGSYDLDFTVIGQNLGRFETGIEMTIALSAIAILLSFPLGLGGALLREHGTKSARYALFAYVELFRNLPMLVVAYVLFFVIPSYGIPINAFKAGATTLTLTSTAFTIEIFRGGLQAIPKGQYEAAAALGLSRWNAFSKVIVPQLVRVVLPPIGNQVVAVVLGSAQMAVIGVAELTYQTLNVGAASFRYFEAFIAAAILYVAIIQFISLIRYALVKTVGRKQYAH